MASSNDHGEPTWIQKLKSSGAVPCLDLEDCSSGWATPSGDKFMVRGPEYLSTKVKVPGGKYILKPLGFDWIKGSTKLSEILNDPKNRVRKAIDDEVANGGQPFAWAFNLQLPHKDNYSVVMYFAALDPIDDGSLMDQFLKGDDAFRNSRLKLIANITQGPWLVKTAVGEQAICIIGRALNCKYTKGSNFMEVDVDVGSSIVANAIVHLAFSYIASLTVDLAFLIEGQTETELPERLLGGVRLSGLSPDSADICEMSSEEKSGDAPLFQHSNLWRSFGQGFSQLLQQGYSEDSDSSSHSCNGGSNGENSDTPTK